jgi:hypothetical protein
VLSKEAFRRLDAGGLSAFLSESPDKYRANPSRPSAALTFRSLWARLARADCNLENGDYHAVLDDTMYVCPAPAKGTDLLPVISPFLNCFAGEYFDCRGTISARTYDAAAHSFIWSALSLSLSLSPAYVFGRVDRMGGSTEA